MYSTTYLKEISEYFQNQFIVPIHSDNQNRHLFIETKKWNNWLELDCFFFLLLIKTSIIQLSRGEICVANFIPPANGAECFKTAIYCLTYLYIDGSCAVIV